MTLSYFWRLFFLCAATFFLLHTLAAMAARFFAPSAMRLARRIHPRAAARFLLALRLAPAALAVFAVLGLCIPSYLSFEPGATRKNLDSPASLRQFSPLCSNRRFIRSRNSRCHPHHSLRAQMPEVRRSDANVRAFLPPIIVIDDATPVIATVGVFRPRFVISRGVLNALSPEELDCAICHELAHRTSADNFKRLLLLLAPDVLPFFSRTFSVMDRSWVTFSEWAADDAAVANDLQRSLSLAGALVHVAQMGAAPRLSPLCTALVSNDSACMNQDLSARVDRLLHTARLRHESPRSLRAIFIVASMVTACAVFVALLRPDSLHSVHELLEFLTH